MHEAQLIDHRFAIIAVKKKIITREAYNNALKQQKLLYAKTRNYTLIGDILLSQGAIKKDQINDFFSFTQDRLKPSHPHAENEKKLRETQAGSRPKLSAELSGMPREKNGKTSLTDDKADTLIENVTTDQTDKDVKKETNIMVAEDNMSACISFCENDALEFSLEDVKNFLETKGIKNGIVDDDLIMNYFEQGQIMHEPCLVAEGTLPVPCESDKLTCFFDTNPMRIGTVTDDGNIDWKNRGEIPQVEEGTLIAEIKPGKEGTFGVDIFGRNILPPSIDIIRLKTGKGVEESEDGFQFHSLIKGRPHLYENNTIDVSQIYTIDGGVDIKTGHIDFDGHIEVGGIIEKGFCVKGKSLRAKGIIGADVKISGDIVVSEGVFTSKIVCNGRVKMGHIHNSDVVVQGDIDVATEITESTIETSGKCVVEGTILYSKIFAKKGIKSKNIGSEAASPSSLTVGIDFGAKRKVAEINKLISQKKKECEEQEMLIKPLREKSDQLSTTLGETAQVQDALMVEKRVLTTTEKEEAKELSESDMERLRQIEAEIVKVDETVEKIMEEDDKIVDNIYDADKIIGGMKQELVKLNENVQELIELSKKDKGVPSVKNSGAVFAGTKIKGPNASIVIKENLNRVLIKERKNKNTKTQEMSVSSM